MSVRSWRALTIVLVLASAAPPPRVTNALIASAHRHDPAEAGKTFQSRARNRIGSTVQVTPARTIAGLASGQARLARLVPAFARRPEPPILLQTRSNSPVSQAPFRLRC